MKKLLLILLLASEYMISFSQAGSLDPTFSTDGKTLIDFTSARTGVNSIAIQADGKVVAGGFNQSAGMDIFTVVRLNTDGSLDNTFDGDGKVTTDLDIAADAIFSIAIQPDGKIVAGGYSIGGNGFRFALARYNTNGSLDNTFDGDGIVTTEVGSGAIMYSLALQPDGKIVAAGYSDDGSKHNFALARYKTNGSLDSSFDADGIVSTTLGLSNDTAFSVLILPGGKIIVAGTSNNGTNADFGLARYNSDGSLDTSFDTDGKVITAVGSSEDEAFSIAVQADGKFIVAGTTWNGANNDFALVRYNTNGSLDNGFDGDGKVTTPVGSSDDQAHGVALLANGKIIAVGYTQAATNFDFALVRYNNDGSLDNSFDGDGKVVTDITGNTELGIAIKLSGLRIYVGGITFGSEGIPFAAYQNDALGLTLPLQLTQFTGIQRNNSVQIHWQTAYEQNASQFIIQRSADGKTFEDIGSLPASGNSNSVRNYSFTDPAPVRPTSYYRLRQVDTDGRVTYSPVIKIVNNVSVLLFSMAPNPANNFINITYPGKKELVTVKIHDAQGRLVKQQTGRNELPIKVEVKQLQPGIYFIQLTDGETLQKGKFIKQ